MNIEHLLWGLEELSDREYQERVWAGKEDGEMSSFVEAYCRTFDDSGLGHALAFNAPTDQLSPEAKEKAVRLDQLLRRIPQSAAPSDIIAHPTMTDVRDLAAELLALMKSCC